MGELQGSPADGGAGGSAEGLVGQGPRRGRLKPRWVPTLDSRAGVASGSANGRRYEKARCLAWQAGTSTN